MISHRLAFILLFIGFCSCAFCQGRNKRRSNRADQISIFNLGLGMGLDYGGFGTRVTAFPKSTYGFFSGVGYNVAGIGFNGGGIVRMPNSRFCPYFIGMYGYNAVLIVQNNLNLSKAYYGPTFGLGVEMRNPDLNSFASVDLLVPIRSDEFENKAKGGGLVFKNGPSKILISFGYHFGFQNRR
jgi:hypothetical protein